MNNNVNGKKSNMIRGIIILLLILVMIMAIMLMYMKKEKEVADNSTSESTGNSTGNISNFGYSVGNDEFIYYVAPNEEMTSTNIYRTSIDSDDTKLLFEGGYDIRSLNVIDDKIYFINVKIQESSDEAEDIQTYNEICKMNVDGSNAVVINDTQVTSTAFDMYIMKNEIYYVGDDLNVYKMNLDGKNRIMVQETEAGFLTMNEKYIIYNKENPETGEYITYINEFCRNNERAINGQEIYNPCIYGENIYYIDIDQQMVKISLNDGQEEILDDDFVYNINPYNDQIFYLKKEFTENYDMDDELSSEENENIGIYKLNLANGESSLVKEISHYTSFINVVNGYVYYMDIDNSYTYIKLVDLKTLEEVNLHRWKIESVDEEDTEYEIVEE